MLWPLFRRETRKFQDRAAGIDERPVVSDAPEKQISSEETFDVDIRDHKEMQERLAQLADRTTARLRARQFKAGMVSIKVRRRDFETYTRQRSFNPPTQETRLIAQVAADLLEHWLAEQPRAAVRLLGVGVSDLEPEHAARPLHDPRVRRGRGASTTPSTASTAASATKPSTAAPTARDSKGTVPFRTKGSSLERDVSLLSVPVGHHERPAPMGSTPSSCTRASSG